MRFICGLALAGIMGSLSLISITQAGEASLRIKNMDTDQDTSVVIKKGSDRSSDRPIYEIVTGTEEIAGDPEYGFKDSLASWKTACANWKKEFKEINQKNQVISMNCNSATAETQKHGLQIQKSIATYKLKVLKEGIEPTSTPDSIAPVSPASVAPANPEASAQ